MRERTRSLFLATLVLSLISLPALADDMEVQLDAGDSFVVDGAGPTERLSVDGDTGNISRNGALFVHTTGAGGSTFVGEGAGNTSATGGSNSAFGDNAFSSNTSGGYNSAFGKDALSSNTVASLNSAFGWSALLSTTAGAANSAFGSSALRYTTGAYNSAFGTRALYINNAGAANSAFGGSALRINTTGSRNSAFGKAALESNTSGMRNVAAGYEAGTNQTTGSDNIYIANDGVAAESGKIKIGNSAHTEAFIEGIDGNTATGGVAVLINSSNELHTLVSSIRFKEAVRDMGTASDVLMKLRPVSFRYREGGAEADATEYGLIAEEVEELAPELVAHGSDGEPHSVRYHVLPSMLINEMQKQQRTIEGLQRMNTTLLARLDAVESRLRDESTGTDQ